MINSIQLENFKIFKEKTVFPLSNINLLTGVNGRGKSSFLQSILLFKQTLDNENKLLKRLILNGECVQLGTFDDIMNATITKESHIGITFNYDNISYPFSLIQDKKDDMIAKIQKGSLSKISFLKNLHYIAADRVGPQQFYLRNTLPTFLSVGTKGEYIGNVLYQKRDDIVHESLYLGNLKSEELIIQAGEWLGKILDTEGLKIQVKEVGNGVIILSFQFGISEKEYKPSNVGFGYSFILPIVVTGLIAKKGETIIIENPEAHLHPKAQSNLVEFLAKISKCGIQIFIESHSEHILNALRVCVSRDEPIINSTDVSVLFFKDDDKSRFDQITIESDGSIDNWPDNFFDQTKIDLQKILNF